MADKDPKQEEASEAAPAVAAKDAEGVPAGTQGEEKAKDEKKKEKKGNKEGKGKGGGKGKGKSIASGPFGHGDNGFRLNVKNFGADMTTEQLRTLFEPCGKVTDAEVKVREDGKSRGFGYVIFASEEEAKKAIADMNNKDVDGKPLSVSPAERRPQEAGEEGKGKGKGKDGKGKKGGDAFQYAQMQAAMYQQQMMAMQQWYAYMGAMSGAGAGGAAGAPVAAAPVNPEYEGSLKTVSTRNGYGFIVCAATWARYERDVYVDKEVLPEGAKPPDRLIFTLTLNAKGHPKAATCRKAV